MHGEDPASNFWSSCSSNLIDNRELEKSLTLLHHLGGGCAEVALDGNLELALGDNYHDHRKKNNFSTNTEISREKHRKIREGDNSPVAVLPAVFHVKSCLRGRAK